MANKSTKAQAQAQAQANAQAGAQAKRTSANTRKAYTHVTVGTHTYTDPHPKAGEKTPKAQVVTRFREQDWAKIVATGRAHKGSWSRYAGSGVFLFDSTANAKAFASDIDKLAKAGTIVPDPKNLATRKARKEAGLNPHTKNWYASREKKSAKQTSTPAKKSGAKGKTVDIEDIVAKAVAAALASLR